MYMLLSHQKVSSKIQNVSADHCEEDSAIVIESQHITTNIDMSGSSSVIDEQWQRNNQSDKRPADMSKNMIKGTLQRFAEKGLEFDHLKTDTNACKPESNEINSPFLNDGEGHFVWKPQMRGSTQSATNIRSQGQEVHLSLSERRKNLENRVHATRAVLRANTKQAIDADNPSDGHHMTFKDAACKVRDQLHPNEHYKFHDVVSRYVRAVNRTANGPQSHNMSAETSSAQHQITLADVHGCDAPFFGPSENTSLVDKSNTAASTVVDDVGATNHDSAPSIGDCGLFMDLHDDCHTSTGEHDDHMSEACPDPSLEFRPSWTGCHQ